MEFALKSEIYCFIHLHSLLRIVFADNIYYIFAKLSLANIRPRFSNKPIVHSRHRGRCTQKFKNNHFTFLKNTELRLFNRKESQSNSPVQLSSPAVQSNCPVQLSSPTVQSSPVHVLYYAVKDTDYRNTTGTRLYRYYITPTNVSFFDLIANFIEIWDCDLWHIRAPIT